MRLVVVNSSYPPDGRSGYALGCQRIVDSLKARGHEIGVLTAAAHPETPRVGGVCCHLVKDSKENSRWQAVFLKELVNQASFKMLCRDLRPDALLAFDLTHISVSLAFLAHEMRLPVCFYIASDWLATWERDRWYQTWPKESGGFRVLRFLSRRFDLKTPDRPLDFAHVAYVSRHLENMVRNVGQTEAGSAVIPWGVDVRFLSQKKGAGQKLDRLLYVGQVKPQKGIDTAIRALGILKDKLGHGLSLTIAGDDRLWPEYTAYLKDLASACGVIDEVTFTGFVPPENMPKLYHSHDIFVFPSVVVEPQTVSLLEAMSCGLAIVSTATGGNADILQDEFNALVIPLENPESCARQILRLAQEPELLESLGVRARQTIETNYRLEQSAVSLENFLSAAVGAARPAGARPSSVGPAAIVDLLPPPSLDKLVRQANSWLRWGSLIVLARNLFKPKTVLKALKKIYRDGSSFTSLLLFPAICRGFFYVTHRPRTLAKAKMPQPRQVLVVQLADLGDIILTSPFLRELRRFLPGTRIVLAVQPSMADLLKYCPYIDGLVAYDWRTVRNWQTAFKGNARWWWKSLWTMRRSFWKDRFDTAISLRWNNDPCQAASLILMYASGASRRVAYVDEANDFKLLSMRYVDKLITEGPVRGPLLHEVEYQRDILRFLGARPQDTGLEVWTSPEDERFAQDLLARHGLTADDRLVALAPGARWAFRRWPEGRFRELGRWLQEDHGASILIMAGKSERDLARRIAGGLQEKRTLNLAGKTTLRQMAAVLKRCQLFVGNDSGPLHVAAACGVPALGLFGTGEYERFRPWGLKQGVIRLGLTCNPCSENCHFAEARCIQGITVDQVKRALAEKLKVILK